MNTFSPTEKRSIRSIFDRLELCGCGDPEAAPKVILMLLERAENHDKGSFYDPEGSEYPFIEFGAKVLDSWNLIDHGTGIGFAWLTEEGILLLRFLREYGTKRWPDWATINLISSANGEPFDPADHHFDTFHDAG